MYSKSKSVVDKGSSFAANVEQICEEAEFENLLFHFCSVV
jgi:hypothetical protein